jgi:hypothetical protein
MIHYNHIEILPKEVCDAFVQAGTNHEQVPIEVKQYQDPRVSLHHIIVHKIGFCSLEI